MKKQLKIFAFVLMIGVLFSGAAFAASTNGLFEGFTIINLVVDGEKIENDVPAINLKGRTMVPIRVISEKLGADVKWDEKTSTASIANSSIDNHGEKDIDKLKLYSRIADHYRKLEYYGNVLGSTDNDLYVAGVGILQLNDIEFLDTVGDYIDSRREAYNDLLKPTEDIISEAKHQGINVSNMNDILYNYSKAIDNYMASYNYLVKFTKSYSDADYINHFEPRKTAKILIHNGELTSRTGYYDFFNKIQSF